MADLDPRITVMPDGSYFYSGSLLRAKQLHGAFDSNLDRLEDDWLKGPSMYREYEGHRVISAYYPGSRILDYSCHHLANGNGESLVDAVTEHSRYRCVQPRAVDKWFVSRRTDVTLQDVCARYLESKDDVKVFTRRPSNLSSTSKQGKHSRRASIRYGLIIAPYDKKYHTMFRSWHKYSNYVIVPTSHGTMNRSEARSLDIYKMFDSQEMEDWCEYEGYDVEDYIKDSFKGLSSPLDYREEWFGAVCRSVLGLAPSNQIVLSSELTDYFGFNVFWNVSIDLSQYAPIEAHVTYPKH